MRNPNLEALTPELRKIVAVAVKRDANIDKKLMHSLQVVSGFIAMPNAVAA